MTVQLPAVPLLAEVSARLVDFAGMMQPPLGGPGQLVARMGDRYAIDVSLPSLSASCAADWIAARLQAKADVATLSLIWPQPRPAGLPTTGRVNGALQLGTSLVVDGLGAGRVLKRLTFFSFSKAGRSYLHATTSAVTASGGGAATLTISPMLRVQPDDDTHLEFVNPVIEGFLDGTTVDWDLRRLRRVGTSFTLMENE